MAKRSGRSSRHHTRRPECMATAEELIKSAQDRMVKSVEHARAEFATVRTGREIRRDAMRHLKELVDNGEVGADDEHRAEGRVQELTDEHTKHIDELLKHKEAEVMEV